ncbi:MAG: hypothetical protein IKV00_09125, partial [Clostridia bacterium]|nr:hypothetical protein [Clostridia bacterium]
MKNARISSKALAAVLALLMVLSTVIALPAAAVEGAPAVGLKNMVWSYDFSNVGAMNAADTTQYAIDNDLFVLSNTSGGASAVTTDGKGFLKLSSNSAIHGNAVVDGLTEETMPMDFFNLYYGLYDGYNTVDSEYIWEFDFRYDGSVTQYRDATTTYNAADGTALTKLYVTDVGYGFFTGRADNQYYALFRITGDGLMYGRSNGIVITKDATTDLSDVYYRSGNRYYPVTDLGGGFADGAKAEWANCVDRSDASKSYQLTKGETYRVGVKFNVRSVTSTSVSMRATVYVKPEGANDWEACVGYDDYSYDLSRAGSWVDGSFVAASDSATKNLIRLAEVNDQGSIGGKWEIYTDGAKQVLWEVNLSDAGSIKGKDNVLAYVQNQMPSFYLSGGNTNVAIADGFIKPVNNSTVIAPKDGVVDLHDVLTGQAYDGKYFFEFDYKVGTDNTVTGRNDTSTTVAGKTVTAVSDYGDNGGANWNFRMSGSEFIFRVSANGYLYTNDIDKGLTSVATGIDGYVYYTDTTLGKVYFDAKGYRYTETAFEGAIEMNGKYYVDDPAGNVPTVSGMSLSSCLDPQYLDRAYHITKGTTYRIGLETVKVGTSVKHTVYIKKAGADNWEKCVGTSTQTIGSTITFTGANGTYYGGLMKAYTYICCDAQHMPGRYTSVRNVSDDGVVYYTTTCDWCGVVDSVTRNGVGYTGTVVNNKCEGSYTLWTSTENASDTFKTDVVAGSHGSIGDKGQCSVCKAYVYFENFPVYSNGTVQGPTYGTKDYNGDGSTTSPAYSKAYDYVYAPESGMILRALESNVYNFASPFVTSIDIRIDAPLSTAGIASKPSNDQAWPLLEYRSGISSISSYGTLVGLYTERDADGNAIGHPWLVLNRDGGKKLCQLTYGEYYHISASADPVTKTFTVYVNGECVGNGTFSYKEDATAGFIAVGIQTFGDGYYVFAYTVKDISFVPVTVENMFGGAGSNT